MACLIISDSEFRNLPDGVQQVLLTTFFPDTATVGDPLISNDDEEPPELSPAQAKNLISGCGAKTVDVVREILKSPPSGFKLANLEEQLGVEPGGLRGSWTGLTKVSRRVLADPHATLIWWTQLADGTWHGRVSEMTYKSLRKALGV